jgi:hypothetical protein
MDEVVNKVVQAVQPGDTSAEEKALVAQWAKTIEHARKKDEPFRKVVVRDRKYCSGEALLGWEVSTNLIQATIETLIPFMYAKDPDVDVVPQDQVAAAPKLRPQPPQPPTGAIGPDGLPMMAPDGVPVSPGPEQMVQHAVAMAKYQAEMAEMEAKAKADRDQNDFIRRLSQTIEIVISRLWTKAKLKREAKKTLRGSMSSAEGWMKVSLQGDLRTDPTVQQELYTLQQQYQAIDGLERRLAQGEQAIDYDAKRAELQVKIDGAQSRVETYVARCLVIDWIDTLDMQTSLEPRSVSEGINGPWMADRTFFTVDEASDRYGIDKARLASATRYKQAEQPVDFAGPDRPAPSWAQEADGWTKTNDADSDGMVCCWEVWSRKDNIIYTFFEGTEYWAKPPQPPRFQTTRFYPYFLLALYEVDGQRHSQSLSSRLSKLQDEFASARSNFAEVRRRAKQAVIFDKTNISPEDAERLENGTNQELIGISPLRPGEPISSGFAPKPYNSVDGSLYDTGPIQQDMEAVSGAQDALRGGQQYAKTATQSEIEAAGGQARTGYGRDNLDEMLTDMAQYTAELALQGFTAEQVRTWAGPHAVWPQGTTPEKLESLVYVSIRAGSSGKPNTSSEREAWAAILPQLQAMMAQIGQARGADPAEMADKMTELLRETVSRTGDKIDVDRFLPMTSPGGIQGMGQGMQPLPAPTQPAPMPAPEPAVPGIAP